MKTFAWILAGLAGLLVAAVVCMMLVAVYAAEELKNKIRIAPAAAKRWPQQREPGPEHPEKMEAVHVDLKDGMNVNPNQNEEGN